MKSAIKLGKVLEPILLYPFNSTAFSWRSRKSLDLTKCRMELASDTESVPNITTLKCSFSLLCSFPNCFLFCSHRSSTFFLGIIVVRRHVDNTVFESLKHCTFRKTSLSRRRTLWLKITFFSSKILLSDPTSGRYIVWYEQWSTVQFLFLTVVWLICNTFPTMYANWSSYTHGGISSLVMNFRTLGSMWRMDGILHASVASEASDTDTNTVRRST